MVGAVARNPHTGSRSEILADYLLSGWGTVTPVRRQDDFGVDLYCTLTAAVGQRSVVTHYYSVQVKSDDGPWRFESTDEIRWLLDYPTPLFLACVDKTKTLLSIYHTMPRFLAGFWDVPHRLELTPTNLDMGTNAQWTNAESFSLSAPVLRVSLADMSDVSKLDALQAVFRYWVDLDMFNCDLRRIGLLRFRMPYSYKVNQEPAIGGYVEQGMSSPNAKQLARAVRTLVESVDCVGSQLRVIGDRDSALYAALLLRRVKARWTDELKGDPRWRLDEPAPFEMAIARELNPSATYLFETVDKVLAAVDGLSLLSTYLRGPSGGGGSGPTPSEHAAEGDKGTKLV